MILLFNNLQGPHVSDFSQAAQNRTDSSNWAAFWSVCKAGSDNLGFALDFLKNI